MGPLVFRVCGDPEYADEALDSKIDSKTVYRLLVFFIVVEQVV